MESLHQLVRFGVVGLLSNVLLFVLYLVLTSLGMGHKTAMTLLYAVGIMQTFLFNKSWTFRHHGHVTRSFIRYLSAYALCYLVNLATLLLLVDQLGYPHQWVQGAMVIAIALLIFLLQKFWVFPQSRGGLADLDPGGS